MITILVAHLLLGMYIGYELGGVVGVFFIVWLFAFLGFVFGWKLK